MRFSVARAVMVRAAVAVMLGLLGVAAAAVPAARAAAPIVEVSGSCAGQNAEVEAATAAPSYIYQVWIGCGGIGYACTCREARPGLWPAKLPSRPSDRDDHRSCACGSSFS